MFWAMIKKNYNKGNFFANNIQNSQICQSNTRHIIKSWDDIERNVTFQFDKRVSQGSVKS